MNPTTPKSDYVGLISRMNNYLGNGGLFNPELMEHEKVRDMILNCRDFLNDKEQEEKTLKSQNERLVKALAWAMSLLAFIHTPEAEEAKAVLKGGGEVSSTIENLRLSTVIHLVHILTGPGGQCMCGIYDGEAWTCGDILKLKSEDIQKEFIIAEHTKGAKPI